MLKDKKNSRKQGDVGLGSAIAWFTSKGHTVCIPLTDSQKYDLIIDDGELKRVQVKTTYFKDGKHYVAALKTCGGNRTMQKIKNFNDANADLVFILTEDSDRYLIPSKVLPKTAVTLYKKYDKYKL